MDTTTSAAELRARLSTVAEALYRLENDAELALLRDPSQLRGRSASIAIEVATRTARLWERYPTVKDVVDRLVEPDNGLRDQATQGVGELEADLAAVEGHANTLTRAWADLLPRLDDLAARTAALATTAAELEVADEPEVTMAQAAVDRLATDIAADPLDADPAPVLEAVDEADAFVGDLCRQRDELSSALAAADSLVEDLAQLIEHGPTALERTRSRIASPDGLLEPVDAGILDDGPQGLRPWLARIREEADRGEWRTASTALARWRAVADGWLANAERVLDANSAPVRRRDELRGLLDAYRAKSIAAGMAEDVELGRLHEEAHDALHVAPCVLSEAEARVQAYVDAVNGRP